jgi:Ca2+/Na+ antiporter
MIPPIFFLGLNNQQLILFEIVQTIFDLGLNFLLIFLVLKKIGKEYGLKDILITIVFIELVHLLSFFMWWFFVLYAIAGFILLLIFYFFAPYFVIYIQYTPNYDNNSEKKDDSKQKRRLSIKKGILLYVLSVPFALILSNLFTSLLFNLFGMYNFFIIS